MTDRLPEENGSALAHPARRDTSDKVVIGLSLAGESLIVGSGLAAGASLGLLAPYGMAWALAQAWLPMRGPVILLDQLAGHWGDWVLIVFGAVAGLVAGLAVVGQLVKIHVSARDLTVVKGSQQRRFARAQVRSVLLEDGHLVLRDERDADLIRERFDGSPSQLWTALRRFDWPVEQFGH